MPEISNRARGGSLRFKLRYSWQRKISLLSVTLSLYIGRTKALRGEKERVDIKNKGKARAEGGNSLESQR